MPSDNKTLHTVKLFRSKSTFGAGVAYNVDSIHVVHGHVFISASEQFPGACVWWLNVVSLVCIRSRPN